MRVCFDTFGCRLSRAEALDDEARYIADGWEVTTSHQEADLIILRGCSVTGRAQHQCEKLIEHLRQKYPNKRLLIKGCLKEAEKAPPDRSSQPPVPTRTARAYLKVQDGCSGKCSFCIVPQFRGNSVSTDFDLVLDRAKRFIEAGYHEIVITGCNLALYASHGRRLPELLAALAGLDSDCRIRLGSLEPSAVAQETISVIAEQDNLCNFLHLPIQSGSNRLLSLMRRPYRINDADQLIDTAVRKMPHLGLGCDLITGFPEETDADHTSTLGFLKRHPFSNAHVFPYSRRPGTIAAIMQAQVSREVAKERATEIMELIATKRRQFINLFKGQNVAIVIEDEEHGAGWTAEYVWCEIAKTSKMMQTTPPSRKALLPLRIRFSTGEKLQGEVI